MVAGILVAGVRRSWKLAAAFLRCWWHACRTKGMKIPFEMISEVDSDADGVARHFEDVLVCSPADSAFSCPYD